MQNCDKTVYFEARKRKDLYMWATAVPRGPSAKFLVTNIHTMSELKLTGNSLKGSRPVLAFDSAFDEEPHLQLIKEVLTQTFGTPNQHPKSQPFIDHVFNFAIFDDRIWFRNYQIVHEENKMEEIGPRFVLQPICILEGSFGGPVLYENPEYVSPNVQRREQRNSKKDKYVQKVEARKAAMELAVDLAEVEVGDPTDDIFESDPHGDFRRNRLKRKIDRKVRRTKNKKRKVDG